MWKIFLTTLFTILCLSSQAQKVTFKQTEKIIKMTGKDSLADLPENIKNQLLKQYPQGTKQTGHPRFSLTISDKTERNKVVRWIAAKQNQDIYQISLSGLISKYIGETEKNLELLFNRAESKNWILLFDEADALFEKRTETGSSEDNAQRQAIDYFIKRAESFKGTILITCAGEDCLGKMTKINFIKITG